VVAGAEALDQVPVSDWCIKESCHICQNT